jgi:hypothetical protein
MSSFNNVFAEEYYLKGELLTLMKGDKGEDGKDGTNGTNGVTTTVSVDGTETVVSGLNGTNGTNGTNGVDGKVDFKSIRVSDGMVSINLPPLNEVDEAGLYYYKDSLTETNTTFYFNGVAVGKFYYHRIQNITFLKANGKWVN